MQFLSIIIPVYKVEPYLRECFDSITASELDCWEAILIDDGSPDRCPQICDEYTAKDKRFRVVHQRNAGVAAARNTGIDIAKGEWIWFVDSDDFVDMRPVGNIVKWLQEHHDVDLVMFDLNTFKENERTLYDNDCESDNIEVRVNIGVDKNDFLSQHISFFHQQFWFRREIVNINKDNNKKELIHFSRGIRVAEDLERMYKYLTLCQQPVRFEATLYHYRVRENSVTQDENYRKKAVEDLPVVLGNLAGWIRKYDIKPEPWLDLRIKMLFQNLLYSASLIDENKNFDIEIFQKLLRDIVTSYRSIGFFFINKLKYHLALLNVKFFFLINRIYLLSRGYD